MKLVANAGFIVLKLGLLSGLISSHSMTLAHIKWILGNSNESHTECCQRNLLQPLDMKKVDVQWNQSTIEYVVYSVLNLSLNKDNAYGIKGCCSPSLWCQNNTCYTQSYGQHFDNYGPLVGNSQARPVYSCSGSSSGSVGLTGYSIASATSSAKLNLLGIGFGYADNNLEAYVSGYRCHNAATCNCPACSASVSCPIGMSCLLTSTSSYISSTGFCYKACAGAGDQSCACSQVCRNAENIYGIAVSACLPTDSNAINSCHVAGGSQLQCDANSALFSFDNSSSKELALSLVVGSDGNRLEVSYNNAKSCLSNNTCFDGNICTLDTCINNYCVYMLLSECSSALSTIQEHYTPYTYDTVIYTNSSDHDAASIAILKASSSYKIVKNSDSSATIKLPFRILFFGNVVDELRIYGNGIVAFPPYSRCASAKVGPYSVHYSITWF
jgi:hypothetical protein